MIRKPVVAGQFYQENPERLKNQIASCFSHKLGCNRSLVKSCGTLIAAIAPHAGYMFSGPVASHIFARIAAENPGFETIILMGPKHTRYGSCFSVASCEAWQTPLGMVKIDSDLVAGLTEKSELFESDNLAHAYEHSLEVMLPFLQQSSAKTPQIVPVAIGYADMKKLKQAAVEIGNLVGRFPDKKILILVSSDFSHDTPREDAYRLDNEVIEYILKILPVDFYNKILSEDRSVCGVMPITVLLEIMKNANVTAKLLKYATSMDVVEHERGVGYASIIFEEAG